MTNFIVWVTFVVISLKFMGSKLCHFVSMNAEQFLGLAVSYLYFTSISAKLFYIVMFVHSCKFRASFRTEINKQYHTCSINNRKRI